MSTTQRVLGYLIPPWRQLRHKAIESNRRIRLTSAKFVFASHSKSQVLFVFVCINVNVCRATVLEELVLQVVLSGEEIYIFFENE
jgi:hypothetical protein